MQPGGAPRPLTLGLNPAVSVARGHDLPRHTPRTANRCCAKPNFSIRRERDRPPGASRSGCAKEHLSIIRDSSSRPSPSRATALNCPSISVSPHLYSGCALRSLQSAEAAPPNNGQPKDRPGEVPLRRPSRLRDCRVLSRRSPTLFSGVQRYSGDRGSARHYRQGARPASACC
jgi:hypothetical protein